MIIAKLEFYVKTNVLAKCTEGVLSLVYKSERWECVAGMPDFSIIKSVITNNILLPLQCVMIIQEEFYFYI